ncbi:MAG TPA: hypothetical protein VGN86_10605, partial [Pyrinomonadaceae bacterium]|nr:hypothetical protein [Pyrinomonadaceae bacterium]
TCPGPANPSATTWTSHIDFYLVGQTFLPVLRGLLNDGQTEMSVRAAFGSRYFNTSHADPGATGEKGKS